MSESGGSESGAGLGPGEEGGKEDKNLEGGDQ